MNHQSGGKHAQVNNHLSIYHTDAKKLVYFFQYTKKCSEIKLAMRDFVQSAAWRLILLAIHFQISQSAQMKSTTHLCGIH